MGNKNNGQLHQDQTTRTNTMQKNNHKQVAKLSALDSFPTERTEQEESEGHKI